MLANGNFWFAYMLANGHFWFAYMLANGSHLLTCEQMLFGLPTCWQTKELIKGFLANQKPILSVDLLANFAKVEVPLIFDVTSFISSPNSKFGVFEKIYRTF